MNTYLMEIFLMSEGTSSNILEVSEAMVVQGLTTLSEELTKSVRKK